jgi:hypothetical protein
MKVGRSVLRLGRWAAIAFALVMPASGCCGTHTEVMCGASAATVSVSAPAALRLGPTLLLSSVRSCLDGAGGCSSTPSFILDNIGGPMGGLAPKEGEVPPAMLRIMVSFPATAAGGTTLTLPSPDIQVEASLDADPSLDVSGTISVESASRSGYQLSLQLELKTSDGQTITLSGPVSASNCAAHQVQSACGGGFS